MLPKNYKLLYPSHVLESRLKNVSIDLSDWLTQAEESSGKQVLVVGVLHGAVFVLADLLRHITQSVEPAFCRVSSYSKEDNTQGELDVALDHLDVAGRAVLLVDDICDTGATLQKLDALLRKQGAADVKSLVLLRRLLPSAVWNPDWAAIEHEGAEWFVGYGMDDRGRNRNLPHVYYLSSDD